MEKKTAEVELNDEATLEEKQQFLRREIIDKNYDGLDFYNYMQEMRGEGQVSLEYWSMVDLLNVIDSYKKSILEKQKPKESESTELKEEKKNHYDNNNLNLTEDDISNDWDITKNRTEISEDYSDLNDEDFFLKSKPNTLEENSQDLKLFDDLFDEHNDENENTDKINCLKLEPNELTNRNDLIINIDNPTMVKSGLFSEICQYDMETKPIGFKTKRKVNDFDYLYQKLPLINSTVFNPLLPPPQFGLKDDSSKKVLYLNFYMNSLIQSNYFRTTSIVYDFLKLPIEEWEKKKIEKYDKIKETIPTKKIRNLEGFFSLCMEVGDDEKGLQIKEEILKKNESFEKFNSSMDDLLGYIEKVISSLKSVTSNIEELKKSHISVTGENNFENYFNNLGELFSHWIKVIKQQRCYLRNEIKYFFKYINKENNSFLKNKYNSLKESYSQFKLKFEKMKKTVIPHEKDKKALKALEKNFRFHLVNVFGEYKLLNIRQAERFKNLFGKLIEYKDKTFNYLNKHYDFKFENQNNKENNKEANSENMVQNGKHNEE